MFKKLLYLVIFGLITSTNSTYGKEINFVQTILPLDPAEYTRLLKLYTHAKVVHSQNHELTLSKQVLHKTHTVFGRYRLTRVSLEKSDYLVMSTLTTQKLDKYQRFIKPG